MLCWLFGHSWRPNLNDISEDLKTCEANCKRCHQRKRMDFGEYSMFYADLVDVRYTSKSATMSRDIVKSMQDPWGRKIMKRNMEQMDEWAKAGYPMSWWGI